MSPFEEASLAHVVRCLPRASFLARILEMWTLEMFLWAGELDLVCFLSCTGAGEKAASHGLSHYEQPVPFLGPTHAISRVARALTGDCLVYGIGGSFLKAAAYRCAS